MPSDTPAHNAGVFFRAEPALRTPERACKSASHAIRRRRPFGSACRHVSATARPHLRRLHRLCYAWIRWFGTLNEMELRDRYGARTDRRGFPAAAVPAPLRAALPRFAAPARCAEDAAARCADRRDPARRVRAEFRLRPRAPSTCRRRRSRRSRRRRRRRPSRRSSVMTRSSRAAAGRTVPPVSELRLGDRHPSVTPLRARLAASGDLDPNAVGNDIYDSYVEARGAALPGAPRPHRRRHRARARRWPRSTCRRRRGSLSSRSTSTRLARSAPISARVTSSAIFRPRASRRSRTASPCRATPPSSASPTGRRPKSTARSSRSTSIRIGRCRPSIVRKDLIPKMQDQPDYLTNNHIRIFDGTPTRAAAVADQLVLGGRDPLLVQAGSRRASIRSARSASISRARTASTCTTRR